MSAFADLADAATRSSVGHLFRQLLLATPKTRGLTMTLTRAGDLKFSSYPVQQPSRRAAMQQQSRSSPKGEPPQRSAPHAPPRRVADRAAVERAGQPPPYPKPSTAKDEQAPHPGVPAPAAPPPAQLARARIFFQGHCRFYFYFLFIFQAQAEIFHRFFLPDRLPSRSARLVFAMS